MRAITSVDIPYFPSAPITPIIRRIELDTSANDFLHRSVALGPIYMNTISSDSTGVASSLNRMFLFNRNDSLISLFALFRSTAVRMLRDTEKPAWIRLGVSTLRT